MKAKKGVEGEIGSSSIEFITEGFGGSFSMIVFTIFWYYSLKILSLKLKRSYESSLSETLLMRTSITGALSSSKHKEKAVLLFLSLALISAPF
jgi:hypothetical protein